MSEDWRRLSAGVRDLYRLLWYVSRAIIGVFLAAVVLIVLGLRIRPTTGYAYTEAALDSIALPTDQFTRVARHEYGHMLCYLQCDEFTIQDDYEPAYEIGFEEQCKKVEAWLRTRLVGFKDEHDLIMPSHRDVVCVYYGQVPETNTCVEVTLRDTEARSYFTTPVEFFAGDCHS